MEQDYPQVTETEKAEGFDRSFAELAIFDAMDRIGTSGAFFVSANPGVIAMERIDFMTDEGKLRKAFAEISEKTGFELVCVADCEWSFDDRCDEEATWFAFDIPSLPDDYRDDYRNRINYEVAPAP